MSPVRIGWWNGELAFMSVETRYVRRYPEELALAGLIDDARHGFAVGPWQKNSKRNNESQSETDTGRVAHRAGPERSNGTQMLAEKVTRGRSQPASHTRYGSG